MLPSQRASQILSQGVFPTAASLLALLLKVLFKYVQCERNKWKERFISLTTQSFLNNIIIDWAYWLPKKKINFIRTICLAIDLGTNPAQAGRLMLSTI